MKENQYTKEHNSKEPESDQQRSLRRSWKSSGPVAKLTAVFAGVAALATVVYAFASVWQLIELTKSNHISRDALESVQRAFVTFKEINREVSNELLPPYDKIWGISANWQNSGTTPAILIARYIGAGNEEKIGPSPAHFIGRVEDRITIPGEIGPKSERRVGPIEKPETLIFGGMTFPPADREKILKVVQSENFCIWGWIIYRDVFFPNTPTRLTEFCTYMASGYIDKTGFHPNLQACDEHNCTDENCKDYNTMMQLVPK